MQPSEYEIRLEVEALRDIRRRSTAGGPGSLVLDPDLPSSPSPASPTSTAHWSPTDDSSSSSHEESTESSAAGSQDDPLHLFWVPARLHPEIAPAEFKQFLKEHARTPSDEMGALGRSLSSGSVGLGRKKSMLSRQYKPSADDGIEEEEKVVPIKRNRSVFTNSGPQLTINDLQRLEELAEEASKTDDPRKLRSVLRRSLSLNVAPSVIDQMDDITEMGDEADSPIVVPRPGQILRRSARTKIRKPGQTGEGAHRFTAASRRKKSVGSRAASMDATRSSSDLSSSDHGHAESSRQPPIEEEPAAAPPIPRPESFTPLPRPESYSEESLIYDAYVTDEPDDMETFARTSPEPSVESAITPPLSTASHEPAEPELEPEPEPEPEPEREPEPEPTPAPPAISPTPPVLHHPQPQRAVAPPTPEPAASTPSSQPTPPDTAADAPQPRPSLQESRPSLQESRPSLQESPGYHPSSPSPSEQQRQKDKRGGLFGKWGSSSSDKSAKKLTKESDNRPREKEKEPGFFGSLFGGKKKQEDSPSTLGMGQSGRETAAALLGASKSSKSYAPSPSPQLAGMYARYPIHVERAIYRLSHIKLANPRRPLYEQVLISNLMFWYLGVINKAQNPAQQNGAAAPQPQPQQAPPDKEQLEREQREKEERERAEKERLEQEREMKERSRKGTLTKQPLPGSPAPGGRRAEMPVRGPQYEMQHRAMEQEYGHGPPNNAGAGVPMGRGPASGNPPFPQHPAPRSSSAPPPSFTVQSPQPQAPNGNFYNMNNVPMQGQQYSSVVGGQLPPGAMPPVAVEQTWLASAGSAPMVSGRGQASSTPPRSSSPPDSSAAAPQPSPRRARSPPPNRYTPAQEKQPYPANRMPSRSVSASAAPPIPTVQHVNGKLKKGTSAHAVVQSHRRSEDEDVPLALWQQQQRRK